MLYKFLLMITLIFVNTANGSLPISIVYVDAKTEKELGEFPISRAHYAKLVKKLNDAKAKYIILKFFFDNKTPADQQLINELKKYNNIFTQAYSYQSEKDSELKIESDFSRGKTKKQLNNDIIFPYPEMMSAMSGVGFVNGILNEDEKLSDFELVSEYKGNIYPSLPLVILERELGAKAVFDNKSVSIKQHKIKLGNDYGFGLKLNKPEYYKTYSMIDILNDRIANDKIKDQLVIIFYDGDKLQKAKAINEKMYNPAEVVANAIDSLLFKVIGEK